MSFIGTILAAIGAIFVPRNPNEPINPYSLAVSTSGYRVQSQVLHIPDRFGYFSPGPPSVQVKEGAFVTFLTIALSVANFMGAIIFFFLKVQGNPNANMMPVISMAATVIVIVSIWLLACIKRHRGEGNLKVRKE